MTRQEAIEYLKLFRGFDLPVQEALDMAIRSLEAWDKIYKEIKLEQIFHEDEDLKYCETDFCPNCGSSMGGEKCDE